jgi:hypothetical protein
VTRFRHGAYYEKDWRDSLPIDLRLSAVSVLAVALPSSEIAEGLTMFQKLASVSVLREMLIYFK